MRIGSMCTGAGMLDRAALAVIGGEIVWHTETDPHAAEVLKHHYPDVPNLGDLLTAELPPVDVLVGGAPMPTLFHRRSTGRRRR